MIISIAVVIFAYLAGSVASAILICKLFGLSDPRAGGSGNPGATNVLRLHGKKAAILTLAGDVLKGVVPVLLAKFIGSSELIIALCGLAAFFGHLFPIFFKFKGGKGVATLIGVLFATHWMLGLAYVTTWGVSALLFRYSSLSALIAAILTPVYSWLILQDIGFTVSHVTMVTILIWRHRSNIKNLIAGTETRIGNKKKT
ncbi:MAG: glycerol-3-phosphate 1-O-acyltransferase PlsY [Proteobacteria bacterium]|nr:glycerol-3-phosphate 1-O-acyltransferase [Pseudomonadota bacterium]NOG61058.1 glycerol-3-phosphate 1-O-acyltransferase PlsY [Pseudomonadota bacterium]